MPAQQHRSLPLIATIAGVVGIAAFLLFLFPIDLAAWASILLGILVAIIVAIILWWYEGRKAITSTTPTSTASAPTTTGTPAPAATDSADPSVGSAPPLLTEARAGGADDLKRIKGVGPKMENLLHNLGIFHFDQVAAWTDAELSWVDEHLEGFRGRARRDNWISQATTLAGGGDTEFSQRVDGGGVY